jgi:RNA polymerase sigma factor (sigma-70 family)
VQRFRAGDPLAAAEILRAAEQRLLRLARRMLGQFPNVARWEEADDVVQKVRWRLLQGLQRIEPASVAAFYSLVAQQIRWVLLDLARHYAALHANHASVAGLEGGSGHALPEPADSGCGPAPAEKLERWSAFHRAVEELPAEQREVFGLVFYHGWAQAEVAELFQVDERTVRRRWRAACLTLHDVLGENVPED